MSFDSKQSVFLSAVSLEFETVRAEIANDLRTVGLTIVNQEIFRQVPDAETTLDLLDKHVRESEKVICIVGIKSGGYPGLKSHGTFSDLLPDGFDRLSYTQWELVLARHYKKDVYIFLADETNALEQVAKEDRFTNDNRRHQFEFIQYIKRKEELNRDYFFNDHDLRINVLKTLGYSPVQQSKPHNLPNASLGDLFKGRDDFLTKIADGLKQGAAAIVSTNKIDSIKDAKPTAVSGSGGIGKTRAAIEYAWKHQDDYNALLFINAESAEQLETSLAGLYGVLKIDGLQSATDDIRLAAVLDWLHRHPGWLAILDNVDTGEAQQAVSARLAQLAAGHVLITSRLARWGNSVQKLNLSVLSVEAAISFLQESALDRHISNDDDEQAKRVAEKVGQLALGLEHAKAYINRFEISFADYLWHWNEDEAQILKEFPTGEIEYQRELLITWKLSVDRLNDDSRKLLEVLAWFAPDPIPETVLENLPDSFLTGNARNAIANLVDFCLVNRVQDLAANGASIRSLELHRLVQATTRYHLLNAKKSNASSNAAKLPSLEIALQTINGSFIGDATDVRSWPVLELLAEHAQSTADFAIRYQKVSTEHPTSRLLNDLGLLYAEKARFPIAERNYRRALEIDEQAFGKKHPRVAIRLNNLAFLLLGTNRFAEAEPLMCRALEIDEQSFGTKHFNVARNLNNLALLLMDTNRLLEAEPLMRRALEIDEHCFGKEHPNVGRDLNNLALLLQTTNRVFEAEPMLRRALEIDEHSFGKEHPRVASGLNNLGALLKDTNRLLEAEPMMRRALEIDEKVFGKKHPNVARDLNNLALLLLATNRLLEAEELMRRALEIDEQAFGKEHPRVATQLNNIAHLFQATNRLLEAEPMLRRALEIDEHSFGKKHPNVARDLNSLAQLLKATSRESEAELLLRRALEIDEQAFGKKHPVVGIRLNNLAQMVKATNGYSEAQALMRRAVGIFITFTNKTNHEHPNLRHAVINYFNLLSEMDSHSEEVFQKIRSTGLSPNVFMELFGEEN